uniref:Transmembrane protein n=1 Tax=Medicago truncatula TaxID=3880 RepID=I3SIP9_MEDTR|nr:unknown [Medicago truncatula]
MSFIYISTFTLHILNIITSIKLQTWGICVKLQNSTRFLIMNFCCKFNLFSFFTIQHIINVITLMLS